MCGIVGYIGHGNAAKFCLGTLQRMEYRGYDSAGIAMLNGDRITVKKAIGKLDNLRTILKPVSLNATVAIGHTRWSTHGKPSIENAHPHLDTSGQFAVVHNGIIENYQTLRQRLSNEGQQFLSQTDSEVIVHLLARYFQGDLREALKKTVHDLEGSFAIAAISCSNPSEILAVRRFSSLVVGIGQDEHYIASDLGAIRAETNQVYIIDDDEFCRITATSVNISDLNLNPIHRDVYTITWSATAIEKGEHATFMHKEIFEQSTVFRNCLTNRRIDPGELIHINGLDLSHKEIRDLDKIILSACGTAYHATLYGRYLMEKLAGISAEVELAAELPLRDPVISENTLGIAVSQSGETADTLEALRMMREKGIKVITVINVVDSTIARESDGTVYIQAGPEIGVASSKSYTAQLLSLLLLSLYFTEIRQKKSTETLMQIKTAMLALPEQIEQLLQQESAILEIAKRHYRKQNSLYLARGINRVSAMEGALKLKEISYIHAEAYAGGEIKHGPIALVDPNLLTVAIACQDESYTDMLNNIMEIKARQGPVVIVSDANDAGLSNIGVDPDDLQTSINDVISIPKTHELLSPILSCIPLQLLAYHIADLRGEDIDKPRNLAKTVTVK